MDIFGTAITAGTLILQFLGACSAYSDEAKSLTARFEWDLRVLKAIRDHFHQREASNANGELSAEDKALLEGTAIYLDSFVATVQQSLGKIERKRLMKSTFNRLMWVARRSDLMDMEKEIFEWTRRFDVRVLGLPPEIRTIIPAAAQDGSAQAPAVIRSNDRLREFLAHPRSSRAALASNMLLESPTEIASKIEGRRDISFLPIQIGSEQIIFATRQSPPGILEGTDEFKSLVSDMGELAAALNCLDLAADIKLLKVEYYFYYGLSKQFLFAHYPPFPVLSMMTLETMISDDPFPDVSAPLNQCLKLGFKLAEAVFFLHTAGFLHKNITSTSVVGLQRAVEAGLDNTPHQTLDQTYLMGFNLVRADTARTTKEGAVKDSDTIRSIWDFDIFQHPDYLRGVDSPRYIKTYDVYSLGVVLLEIGFWKPLPDIVQGLNQKDPSTWPKALSETLDEMSTRTGEKYQRVVAWCLGLKGDQIVRDSEFTEKVLDPLEDLINALS